MAHAYWGGQHNKANTGSPATPGNHAWGAPSPTACLRRRPSASPSVPVVTSAACSALEPSGGGLTLPFSWPWGVGRLPCCWALLLLLNVPFVSFVHSTTARVSSVCFMQILIMLCIAQSCPILFCDPMDYCPPGSSVHGIFQARILEWVAISFSRGSLWPRYQTCVSCIGRQILYHWATTEAQYLSLILACLFTLIMAMFEKLITPDLTTVSFLWFLYTSTSCISSKKSFPL